MFLLAQTELESEESDDYTHGFENAILEVHKQYNLRSKKNSDNSNKNNYDNAAENTLEPDPKKMAEISKKNINNSEEKNTKNVIRKTIDVSTKTILIDIPSTSQRLKLSPKQ